MPYFFFLFICLFLSCNTSVENKEQQATSVKDSTKDTIASPKIKSGEKEGYEFRNNGKRKADKFAALFQYDSLTSFKMKSFVESFDLALHRQEKILKGKSKKTYRSGNLTFTARDLIRVTQILHDTLTSPMDKLDAFQIKGEDGRGNVHFTGYYSPIIPVKKERDKDYKYPLYKKPKMTKMPTREQIDFEGALEGKSLALAYAKDQLAVYSMHVQGSGYVQFPDGKKVTMQFGGQNGYKYKSIGKYLVWKNKVSEADISLGSIKKYCATYPDSVRGLLSYNPSYTFFKPSNQGPIGAGGVELVGGISAAVDRKFIPLGASLLAEIPVLNEEGKLLRHELKIIMAQDVGGAIKGPGHIDLYFGDGKPAEQLAGPMHHYGRVWLLLPKKE